MMKALYFKKQENNKIKCELCPHNCLIKQDEYGICNVRKNVNGQLQSSNYGIISSIGFDPIEKKPLYHFYPGAEILSVGSIGCNLKCRFCQNWQISQTSIEDFSREGMMYTPEQVARLAQSKKANLGVAYTYNEPTVFYEYMLHVAEKVKENNQKNIMVTNGFINIEPLNHLHSVIDAYSVDLKAFNNDFFKSFTKSQLEPVKKALINIAHSGKHLEITNLVIPTLNDNPDEFEQMVQWIAENTGNETVFHLSRYYPTYQLDIEATPVETLTRFKEIARNYLHNVYLGNVNLPEANNTYCNKCGELVIDRRGYSAQSYSLSSDGECLICGNQVFKYYKA